MTKQIRLCLPARWGGIRSATALRISQYDKQGHVVGRLSISEKKKPLAVRKIKFFYTNGQSWHIPGKSALASAMCSQVTDTPAAALHHQPREQGRPDRPGRRGSLRRDQGDPGGNDPFLGGRVQSLGCPGQCHRCRTGPDQRSCPRPHRGPRRHDPGSRAAHPAEIASVIAFLASPKAATSPARSSPPTATVPPSDRLPALPMSLMTGNSRREQFAVRCHL